MRPGHSFTRARGGAMLADWRDWSLASCATFAVKVGSFSTRVGSLWYVVGGRGNALAWASSTLMRC